MATKGTLPDGYHSITPYFTVCGADRLIAFLVAAFDATLLVEKRLADGRLQHARLRIGDSILMMNEGSEDYPVNLSQIHLYVADCDTTFSKALAAGATQLMVPNRRPHGDRMAGVSDPCGNTWWIATPQ